MIKQIMLIALCMVSTLAVAHPHSWIELHTRFIGNDKGQLTALKYTWVFDEMTSSYTLDGEDLSAKNRAKTLNRVGASIVSNMAYYHYFSYLYNKGQPVKYHLATEPHLAYDKGKLSLSFTLPIAHPLAMQGKQLELLIYDPTYYIDMSYPHTQQIQLDPILAKSCQIKLISANPDPKLVAYAASLDVDHKSDDSLGQYFAQRLVINCTANHPPTSVVSRGKK
ncbi:DUF1007 family protein [Dongshaea marina]|uniref:DUF1007 family protein n=1 Tax=Dongshaea marina TaxID=2047966 RepID=UPI00131F009E|nr:DUF1007 family protein [Dongshaea marina]